MAMVASVVYPTIEMLAPPATEAELAGMTITRRADAGLPRRLELSP
jgi:hypothetical protein